MADAPNYKHTMSLPKTHFKMKAGLAQKEPERLKKWEQMDLYHQVLAQNKGHKSYILHDGPPYANGPIHIGHALNKTLKDIIVKYKSQRGFFAPYIPGWDCHGLPIENKVEDELGREKMAKIDTPTFRKICRAYAEEQLDKQREGFKRIGVGGEWDDPYLTFTPQYEAGNIKIFKKLYLDGAIYRGRKPIHWCPHCHTALAEAELEYADQTSPAIFVRFELTSTPAGLEAYQGKVDVAIWTTTPWTLPADQAVILHPQADYVAAVFDDRATIFARELVERCCALFGRDCVLARTSDGHVWHASGTELAGNEYKQPIFADQGQTGTFIYDDYVTLEDGTGIVHSAPGHGADDYNAGVKFNIPVVMPVDDDGRFFPGKSIGSGGPWGGMEVNEANPHIIEWLDKRGMLLFYEDMTHSYPHCWRCKNPVIFRATTQWFVSMEKTGLRKAAMEQIEHNVKWIPSWAARRIGAMVAERPDWCISRQRYWGVPIPVFYCDDCGEVVADEAIFDAIIELFATQGADAWYRLEPSEFLPANTACPACGSTHLSASKDVLDVWWESGVSHTSVCEVRDGLRRPADLYLEGSDQHRGWFQSSLLTSVGAYGVAPYKAVMSCGFTVDEHGRKMSKSLGNVIDPLDIMNTLGADVLRLWVGSVDYSQDMAVTMNNFQRVSDIYKFIRNEFRYLLGNLYEFTRDDMVPFNEMLMFDQWALVRLGDLSDEVTRHFDEYHFHSAVRVWHDFLTEFSSSYFDPIKDRLYCDAKKSLERRSAQTVLFHMLECMVRQLAPVLTFTCDEVWEMYPETLVEKDRVASVQLAGWMTSERFMPQHVDEKREMLLALFSVVMKARDVVNAAIEQARNTGLITKSQEAKVSLYGPEKLISTLDFVGRRSLADILIVSDVTCRSVDCADELRATVEPADATKCPRCWNYRELGDDGLCRRCHDVVEAFDKSESDDR